MTNQLKRKLALWLILLGRRMLLNSPVNNWPVAGSIKGRLFRYGFNDKEVEITYKGVMLSLPTRDSALTPGLVGGYYESTELDIFKAISSKAELIIDVGGNVGLYSVLGAVNMRRKGKVIAFEPINENVQYLQKNILANGVVKKVNIEECAIGDSAGELQMYISKNNVGNHSASRENVVDSVEALTVERNSIDQYLKERPSLKGGIDILKIDIEGYDGFAIDGAMNTILSQKPTLFIEYIPRLLKNCGYEPRKVIDQLFGVYAACYLVDEMNKRIVKIPQDNPDEFMSKVGNSNLIFVDRADHRKTVEEFTR